MKMLLKKLSRLFALAAIASLAHAQGTQINLATQVKGILPATSIAAGEITDTLASLENKPSAALAATSNLTLSAAQTVDGVLGTAGVTIVLATAQSTASQNGPWIMQSGAWTRPTWYPSGGTTQGFQFVSVAVRGGTTYADSLWDLHSSGSVTIDTTSTTWQVRPKALNANTASG